MNKDIADHLYEKLLNNDIFSTVKVDNFFDDPDFIFRSSISYNENRAVMWITTEKGNYKITIEEEK